MANALIFELEESAVAQVGIQSIVVTEEGIMYITLPKSEEPVFSLADLILGAFTSFALFITTSFKQYTGTLLSKSFSLIIS